MNLNCDDAGDLDRKKTNHPSVIDIFKTRDSKPDSSEHSDTIHHPHTFDVKVTIPEEIIKEDAEDDEKDKK